MTGEGKLQKGIPIITEKNTLEENDRSRPFDLGFLVHKIPKIFGSLIIITIINI